jgi:hypothetical protein
MSRFKVGERIDRAIETGSNTELQWAAEYCETRLEMSRLSQHVKHWRALLKRIRNKIESGSVPSSST